MSSDQSATTPTGCKRRPAPAPGVPTENLEQQIQGAEAGLAQAKCQAEIAAYEQELAALGVGVGFGLQEIVPNKDFITGRLVNWSLSDPITRVVIPVGIAYGADTVSTEKLLVKVAREHPLVRDDPKPCAWLLGFGDSTLNFELWVYVGRFEDRIPVAHALHQS